MLQQLGLVAFLYFLVIFPWTARTQTVSTSILRRDSAATFRSTSTIPTIPTRTPPSAITQDVVIVVDDVTVFEAVEGATDTTIKSVPTTSRDAAADGIVFMLTTPLLLAIVAVMVVIILGVTGMVVYLVYRQSMRRSTPYKSPEFTSNGNLSVSQKGLNTVPRRDFDSRTSMSALSTIQNGTVGTFQTRATRTRLSTTSGMTSISVTSTVVPGQRGK